MVTVTRIVIRTPTRTNSDSHEDCDQDTRDPCDCWHFEVVDGKKRRELREWHLRSLKNEDSYEDCAGHLQSL